MIRDLSCMAGAFLCAASLAFSQELNVLVIGSTHSFSEGGESGVVHEKPFAPAGIANHLQGILSQDPAITETVNVVFEDIYKTKFLTVNYSGSQVYDFTSRCYSLAQHFMWPEGKTTRLTNLRGEGTYQWDFLHAQPSATLMRGITAPKIGNSKSAEFDQWPKSLKEIATQLGTAAQDTK